MKNRSVHKIMGCADVVDFLVILCAIWASFMAVKGNFLEDLELEFILDNDLFFEIVHPEEMSYTFKIAKAKNFGGDFERSLELVHMVPALPLHGCSMPENSEELKSNVALVVRGECSFVSKAFQMQKAGATAVIVMDSDYDNDDMLIAMQDDATNRDVHIPAVFLLGRNGYMILKTLEKLNLESAIINIPVNVSGTPLHQVKQPPWVIW